MKSTLKLTIIAISLLAVFTNCKKVEGPGGTSAIRGAVVGVNNSLGQSEIIEITVKKGMDLEHGDYWLFNGPAGGSLYYVWYNNPTWVSNGNPNLQGRIGIQVDFNYSDSNLDIAQNTLSAVEAALNGDFTISSNQDILTLVSTTHSEISDADNGTTNFNIDVASQGELDLNGSQTSMPDERVYLIYGDGTVFSETARTGADGVFTFEGLQIGKYKVYALTEDPITGEKLPVYKSIEISTKESINEIGEISIVH